MGRPAGRERPRTGEEPPRHFSMIRGFHLADLFTICNGFCGMAAIFSAIRFEVSGDPTLLFLAVALVPVALFFDFLDGRIARWRHTHSAMGRELDSLADVISFGVTPAVVVFCAGLDSAIDEAVLAFFAVCGLSRLARYNVTAASLSDESGKVKYFEGTPIPTSVVPLTLAVAAIHQGWNPSGMILGQEVHLLVLLFLLSGLLMVSKTLHIPKP